MDEIPEGISPQELENFKEIYLDSAFICRYRKCSRYSNGFKSLRERDDHEKLHNNPLRCSDISCSFFERGFATKSGLSKHNRKYHPALEEAELPHFEPGKQQESEPSPPPPPPPPVQTRPTSPPRPKNPEQAPERMSRYLPTPRHERVSRARKGLAVHRCTLCEKVFLILRISRCVN